MFGVQCGDLGIQCGNVFVVGVMQFDGDIVCVVVGQCIVVVGFGWVEWFGDLVSQFGLVVVGDCVYFFVGLVMLEYGCCVYLVVVFYYL